MTLKQPNRRRFIQAVDHAIKMMESEAFCYCYGREKEYTDLMNVLQKHREQANHNGMIYEIILCDEYGLFESGTAVLGDGTREPLIYEYSKSVALYDGFMMQETSQEDEIYPLRWHHLLHEAYHELAIYAWCDKVHQIVFTNNSSKDVVITLDGCEKMHLEPGKSDWMSHPVLLSRYGCNFMKTHNGLRFEVTNDISPEWDEHTQSVAVDHLVDFNRIYIDAASGKPIEDVRTLKEIHETYESVQGILKCCEIKR